MLEKKILTPPDRERMLPETDNFTRLRRILDGGKLPQIVSTLPESYPHFASVKQAHQTADALLMMIV